MAQRNIVQHGLALSLALAGLTGCNSLNSLIEPDRIDYKSASKVQVRTLEIPPDLTQLQRDSRYAIPEADKGTATASGYSQQKSAPAAASSAVIAPKSLADMRIERSGNQRWLVVKQTPEVLWPQIKDFWQDYGFLINVEAPEAGVMETDWAENRAKIPQDFLRNTVGRFLDSLYSTGERDKFRTRLERGADGSTEIFLSHRGAQEVLTGERKDGSVWTVRPSDPELEAEFLARLMARLGLEGTRAKATVAAATAQPLQARLIKASAGNYVEVDETFDRAWRRVGLALDRVGFTVEDRDRNKGMYFVRYIDQGQEAEMKPNSEKGFLSRLFTFGSNDDKAKSAKRYRVSVKESGATSRISILNGEGNSEVSQTGEKILALLNDQLK